MKIFVLIIAFAIFTQFHHVQSHEVKTQAKRAILGQGHVETVQNSIGDPNKNAYLPPPIQEYPVQQPQYSPPISSGIEPPASTYLPPFENSPIHQDNFQVIQSGFVPVASHSDHATNQNLQSQYRASGYLPPVEQVPLPHQSYQPQQSSNYRGPDYLPPIASHHSDHATLSKSLEQPDNHLHHHTENHQLGYNAPGYSPPLTTYDNHINGGAQQLPESRYRANGYLPPHPDTTGHVNPVHQLQPTDAAYNAPGYLPPHPATTGPVNPVQQSQPTGAAYNAPGYLPPHPDPAGHVNTVHQLQPTDAAYNAPGYFPPVSHQSVSARVPTSIDFDQPTHSRYKAAGHLPPVGGGSINRENAKVPHTVYGIPNSHSHGSIYVSPSVNTASVTLGSHYAPSNTYAGSATTSHESHYSNSAEPNYNVHQQEINDHQQSHNQHYQQTYNTGQQSGLSVQSNSAQTQGYAQKYSSHLSHHQDTQTTYGVPLQSGGVPIPHEYTAPTPMYSQNPTTQYAAAAPTHQTNNGYLPPHHDLLPPNQHHHSNHNNGGNYHHTAPINHNNDPINHNNDYVPPIEPESSQQQYASSFPTYSTNHDGYDYSKPKGASFEDGHLHHNLNHNTIISSEPQSNLDVINVANEGGHQEEIKIIRIIDETKHGDLPNIRTLKIIKETSVHGGPHHSDSVQIIRIISEPSGSPPASAHINNPSVQNHISVPQIAEQDTINNLQTLRSESAGENVEGGYLPPHVVPQPSVPAQPVITSPVLQPPHISHGHHAHVPHHTPPISHHHHSSHHNPPISVPDIRPNTAGYLAPIAQDIRPPGQGQPYLPPLSSPNSHNPTSTVKVIRILHDSNFDQQQDAIYAGVAEQNSNDINTIRVIHQKEADVSGRYGYPSSRINSVKLLRYYRRY